MYPMPSTLISLLTCFRTGCTLLVKPELDMLTGDAAGGFQLSAMIQYFSWIQLQDATGASISWLPVCCFPGNIITWHGQCSSYLSKWIHQTSSWTHLFANLSCFLLWQMLFINAIVQFYWFFCWYLVLVNAKESTVNERDLVESWTFHWTPTLFSWYSLLFFQLIKNLISLLLLHRRPAFVPSRHRFTQ